MSIQRPPQESWDCMLPGPPSGNNGGSADLSPSGLLAYAAGSSVADLCWIQTRLDCWILAAISGPSLLSLYNTATGRCFFKYDATPEFFSCIRRDPFDSRHFCALGLKGFLLSVVVVGDTEEDVVIKELQIRPDTSELQRLERDATSGAGTSNSASPALAVFPTYKARFAFSPHWRHILFVTFPRELMVFDLQYETTLFGAGLPRGCGKFLDVLPDPNLELLHCAHLDGKLSTWRRKDDMVGLHPFGWLGTRVKTFGAWYFGSSKGLSAGGPCIHELWLRKQEVV
ncbi:hypothetical protein U1Q18_048691 [Sarracenia purpurea var. burkii]